MKRDMNLVREILKMTGDSSGAIDARDLVSDKNLQKTAYTIDIMAQGGLVEASVTKGANGAYIVAKILALTWEGNEFLSLITSDSIWAEIQSAIAENGGDASYKLVKGLATDLVTKAIYQQITANNSL